MMRCAPPVVTLPAVLRSDWETLVRLASKWRKLLDLDAYPALDSLSQFCGVTDKPKSKWFWGPNKEIVAVILRPKLSNWSCRFYCPRQKTRATNFEAKLGEIILVVLTPNHWQTVKLGFEAQLRNPRSSSSCARCRPYTTSSDLLIVRPSSTWLVLDHPGSSVPGLLLLLRSSSLSAMPHIPPAHHEISKCDSPHKSNDKGKTTKISQIRSQTSTCQWLITYQSKVLTTWFLIGLADNLMPKGVTILQYANDTIVCLEDNIEKARNVTLLLYMYEQMTG
jgi:hypothetical protein